MTLFDRLRHPLSIVGAILTTAGAVGFVTFFIAALIGEFNHPYFGLVVFVAMPAVFVFGLLLIPLGAWRLRRSGREAAGWPIIDFGKPHVRQVTLGLTALTVMNVVIVLLASYSALHWMESPTFCGQMCHQPMTPQFTAWQHTPHANVACVECHIGEGGRAMVKYKMAGVRQLIHVMTDNYPRPIPASQADLRPALEICGRCHTATLDLGERPRSIRAYSDDEENSETVTELVMHIGGPERPTSNGRAIHWHADPQVKIEFTYTDADRQMIPYVRVTGRDGKVKEYNVEGTKPEELKGGTTRVMDCIDCHNAAAHRISPTADQAVDRAMAAGVISPTLPFIRREAVRLLASHDSPDPDASIDAELRKFYGGTAAKADAATLSRAIAEVQRLRRTNVFPAMKVTWGVYLDNIGHTTSSGCFRCHDGSHVARDGTSISADCSYCHTMK